MRYKYERLKLAFTEHPLHVTRSLCVHIYRSKQYTYSLIESSRSSCSLQAPPFSFNMISHQSSPAWTSCPQTHSHGLAPTLWLTLSNLTRTYWAATMKYCTNSPDWCGSVGWVSFWKVKGHWFNSWSGHMPGLQVQPPVRVHTRGKLLNASLKHWCFSPSLPPSLTISLKTNT